MNKASQAGLACLWCHLFVLWHNACSQIQVVYRSWFKWMVAEIALRWMPLDLIDDKSTLVQVMVWCRQATSHYLSQCWPRSMSPNGFTRPQWVNQRLDMQDIAKSSSPIYKHNHVICFYLQFCLSAWRKWKNLISVITTSGTLNVRIGKYKQTTVFDNYAEVVTHYHPQTLCLCR